MKRCAASSISPERFAIERVQHVGTVDAQHGDGTARLEQEILVSRGRGRVHGFPRATMESARHFFKARTGDRPTARRRPRAAGSGCSCTPTKRDLESGDTRCA